MVLIPRQSVSNHYLRIRRRSSRYKCKLSLQALRVVLPTIQSFANPLLTLFAITNKNKIEIITNKKKTIEIKLNKIRSNKNK